MTDAGFSTFLTHLKFTIICIKNQSMHESPKAGSDENSCAMRFNNNEGRSMQGATSSLYPN